MRDFFFSIGFNVVSIKLLVDFSPEIFFSSLQQSGDPVGHRTAQPSVARIAGQCGPVWPGWPSVAQCGQDGWPGLAWLMLSFTAIPAPLILVLDILTLATQTPSQVLVHLRQVLGHLHQVLGHLHQVLVHLHQVLVHLHQVLVHLHQVLGHLPLQGSDLEQAWDQHVD